MPECDCGAEITAKNSAGHYRESCINCIQQAAQTTVHVQTCEAKSCEICDSWLQETQHWVSYLYAAVQLRRSRQNNPNSTLNQFK